MFSRNRLSCRKCAYLQAERDQHWRQNTSQRLVNRENERTHFNIVGKHFVRCQYADFQIPADIGHITGSNHHYAGGIQKGLPDEFVTVMRKFSIAKLKCK